MDAEDVEGFASPFDVKRVLRDIYGEQAPRTLIVFDPRAVREMNGYFSEETFRLYIHWAYVSALLGRTAFLSEELYSIGTIVGEISTEEILENIFSKFCIGK